jgi:hypothetical protein
MIPWQNQPTLCWFRLALRRRKTSQEKGMIGASLGGTRTALGELEAAF